MPVLNVNKESPLLEMIDYAARKKGPAKPAKVSLVRPPAIMPRYSFAPQRTQPLGLAYVAAVIREAGHDVEMVDAIGENVERLLPLGTDLLLNGLTSDEILERIRPDADIIGISCMFSVEWPNVKALIRKIHQAYPRAILVGGGEHFTALPDFSMEDCRELSFLVLGEGEETFAELIDALQNGTPVDQLTGVAYRSDGKCAARPRTGRIRDIDNLPLPAWDLVPLENYLQGGLGHGIQRGRNISMLASRGCPFQCTFCTSPFMWTTRWLARDPEKVVDEIEGYIQKYRIDNVDFLDLTAIIKKEWIIAFAKSLMRRNIRVTWQLPVGTRSEAIDREVAEHLYQSGCRNMGFSPESGSPVTLKQIKKMVHLGHIQQSMRDCLVAGLNIKFNIIIGFPEETHREIWKSLWFLLKMSFYGAHDASLFPFAPYPGSELFQDLRRSGAIPAKLDDNFFNSLCYVDFTRMQTYNKFMGKAWIRFYQFLGFSIFYLSNYLFRPWRPLATLWHLLSGRFESRGETVLAEMFKRALAGYF